MLLRSSPQEAYRRVEFEARVNCAGSAELVHVCFEHLISALGTAIHAAARGDNALKSGSITRALTAITALQMGVSGEGGVSVALHHLYESARRTILDSTLRFDRERIYALREDFVEIGKALRTTLP